MGIAGKDAELSITYVDGGSVTSITTKLTSISGPEPDFQIAEVSTLGDDFKEFIRTQINPGPINVEGIYDHTIGSALFAIGTAGTPHAFELYPTGNVAGRTKFTGSAIVTTLAPNAGRDDAVLFTASMQVTGALTMGTA